MLPISEPPSIESTFVGREREIASLEYRVKNRDLRVHLTGERGSGKTALLKIFENKVLSKGMSFTYYPERNFSYGEHAFEKLGDDQSDVIAIDDFSVLNKEARNRILKIIEKRNTGTFILSSAFKAGELNAPADTVALGKLDISAILRKRLQFIDDQILKQTAESIIHKHERIINLLSGNPRYAIDALQKVFDYEVGQYQGSERINKISISDIKNAPTQDYFGYLLTLIVFIASLTLSNQSEKNVSDKINDLEQTVATYIEQNEQHGLLYYNVENLNLRDTPSKNKGNIIYTLPVNSTFFVVDTTKGWSRVTYRNHLEKSNLDGWVFSKYIKRIDEK